MASGVLLAVVQPRSRKSALDDHLWPGPRRQSHGRCDLVRADGVEPPQPDAQCEGWRSGRPTRHGRIDRSIVVEAALIATILGLVATWRFNTLPPAPPPRCS